MILFRQIIHFPSQFQDRREKVRLVGFTNIKTDVKGGKVQFTATTAKSGHTTEIEVELINGRISPQSPVHIRCSCESFQFEFMFPAHKAQGLMGALPKLPPGVQSRPKKKNPYSVVTGCKHIIRLAQYIQTQRGKTY